MTTIEERIAQACDHARLGRHVFPVNTTPDSNGNAGKQPPHGYAWKAMADNNVNRVAEDFMNACLHYGADNVGIGWALGLDDCFAIDLDTTDEPEWVRELIPLALINYTARGRHLIFKNPPGIEPGNSTANMPSRAHIDVRGSGGYSLIAAWDRQGLAVSEQPPRVFPHPEYLVPYGGGAQAVTRQEVIEFIRTAGGDRLPNKIRGIFDATAAFTDTNDDGTHRSRHDFCHWLVCTAAEEALAGYYDFKPAYEHLRAWWMEAMKAEPQHRQLREFAGMVAWAVGNALAKAESAPTEGTDEDESLAPTGDNSPFIDWSTFLDADPEAHEWWVPGFWPAHASMLVYAREKRGKSTWVFYCAIEMATGFDLATGERIRDPMRVLYVNYEMDDDLVLSTLDDFGLVERRLDLSGLLVTHKHHKRDFISLDTALGAARFLAHVERERPDAVIFDTWRHTSDGDENDVATLNAFVRHTTNALGSMGVGYMIVDHSGKDTSRGARGSSAKGAEVDEIWSFTRPLDSNVATMYHIGRRNWVPSELQVTLIDDGERRYYERPASIEAMIPDPAMTTKVTEMDGAGMPVDLSVAAARQWYKDHDLRPGRQATFAKAIAYRKDRAARGMVGIRPLPVDNTERLLMEELGAVDNEGNDDGNDPY